MRDLVFPPVRPQLFLRNFFKDFEHVGLLLTCLGEKVVKEKCYNQSHESCVECDSESLGNGIEGNDSLERSLSFDNF